MYFWKINNLKTDLIKGPLSEREKFKYILATTVLFSAILNATDAIFFLSTFTLSALDVYSGLISSAISIFGIIYIYKINGGAKGKHILQRLTALGWVMLIRWFVLIVLPISALYFVVIFVVMIFSTELSESTTAYDVIITQLMLLVYIFLLGRHVKDVSLACATENPDAAIL